MLGQDHIPLFDDHLIGGGKEHSLWYGLSHPLSQLRTRFHLSTPRRLQVLLASLFDLKTICRRETRLGVAYGLITTGPQAVDALDDFVIQALRKSRNVLVDAHQFTLSFFLVDGSDDIEGKVEDTLQVA